MSRYIDADALKANCDIMVGNTTIGRRDYVMFHEIDSAPSIDIVRPQGEWIVNIFDYKSVCSVCGAKETAFIYGTEMWYGLGESKFCPNCGARMKGTDDEGTYCGRFVR